MKRVKTSPLFFFFSSRVDTCKRRKTVLKEEFANINQLPRAFIHKLFFVCEESLKATFL